MPTVASVYGMLVMFFYNDHEPHRFHVQAPVLSARVSLADLSVVEVNGAMPGRDVARLRAWVARHDVELRGNRLRARRKEPLAKTGD